jgi:hypothetical protein
MKPVPAWQLSVWHAALACFLLAAAGGVLLRFGLVQGLPFGLLPGDVRHAHSHLMFFGWVTPVLMLLLLRLQGAEVPVAGRRILALTLFAALASFLPFLLSGYRLTPVLGRALPLSMITSGLNGVAWYAFTVLFLFRARKGGKQERPAAERYFLAAIALLLLSSVGAAALACAGMFKAGPLLVSSLATFFLDLFAEGWFGLALLGLAYSSRPAAARERAARTGLVVLVAGLVLRNLADLLAANGFVLLEPLAAAGSAVAGLGLIAVLTPLWRQLLHERLSLWHLSLGLLLLKAVVDLLSSSPGFAAWSAAAGLRVFYLHAYLLGAVTLGLIAAVREQWGEAAYRRPWLLAGAALLMTASLLPLSGAWPAGWSGARALDVAAWLSPAPLLAVAYSLLPPRKRTARLLAPQADAGRH